MIDTSNNTIITTNALLYKIKDGIIYFLLAQENDGNWGLPGGAKEVKDVNLLNTMKRELKEELGLGPEDYILKETGIKREFKYDHFQSNRFGKHGVVCFFLVHLENKSQLKISTELKDVAWVTQNEALQKLTFDHIKDGFTETSNLIYT